eukprot:8047768-Pyramimonas_sp.AAC.1
MAKYRFDHPDSQWSQLWTSAKSLPPLEQLVAKEKLMKFYATTISRSRHTLSSKRKQETEDAKTTVTVNFRDLCARWTLDPSAPAAWEEIETAVKMQWVKQKKLPPKKLKLAEELGPPEVAKFDYIITEATVKASNKKSRVEEFREQKDVEGDDRENLRAEHFPQQNAERPQRQQRA